MTSRSAALTRVARGDLCAGCGACAAAAPGRVAMALTEPGYLRPVQTQPLTMAQEETIAAICPGLGLRQDAGGRTDHPLWGPVEAVRSGHAADPRLRRHASSGGALSAIVIHMIESGAVDFALQTAASPSLPIGNQTVFSVGAADVFDAAGSRYAPSAPLADLETALARPGRGVFVGKPCDAAALRALAQRDPRVAAKFPYVVSFFCAGVPSLDGVRRILDRLDVAEGYLRSFRFRGDGWPGFATAECADGQTRRMSYAESWGDVLSKHVQFRCKICPDGVGGFADIVCADAWVCDSKGYPLFEEREGLSLILTRTAAGEAMVASAIAASALVAEPTDIGAIAPMQPGQLRRKHVVLARIAGLAAALRPVPHFEGFNMLRAARQAGLTANARAFLGMMRRALTSSRVKEIRTPSAVKAPR